MCINNRQSIQLCLPHTGNVKINEFQLYANYTSNLVESNSFWASVKFEWHDNSLFASWSLSCSSSLYDSWSLLYSSFKSSFCRRDLKVLHWYHDKYQQWTMIFCWQDVQVLHWYHDKYHQWTMIFCRQDAQVLHWYHDKYHQEPWHSAHETCKYYIDNTSIIKVQ